MASILMSTAFCQSGNTNLQLTSSITNYNLSTAASLENVQTQSNAFRIIIRSRNNSYYVSARVTNYSSSNGAYFTDAVLGIKLNNVSPSRATSTNIFYLVPYDQQIISGSQTGNQSYTYSYDLLFGPIGYDFPPGTYSGTVLFSYSQP